MKRLLALSILLLTSCNSGVSQQNDQSSGANVPVGNNSLDSDGDGFTDEVEVLGTQGTDLFDATDFPGNVRDTDEDGCSDFDELNFEGFCDNFPFTMPCPLILDEGLGFSITIPCGFVPFDDDFFQPSVDASSAKAAFAYKSDDLFIGISIFDQSQLNAQSSIEILTTTAVLKPVTTASMDFLLGSSGESGGFSFEFTHGLLASGDLLQVVFAGDRFNPNVQATANILFLSITLQGTDGKDIVDLIAEKALSLDNKPIDRYVVLEDNTVWYINNTSDLAAASSWNPADRIRVKESGGTFNETTLTNIETWDTIDVDFYGLGQRLTVSGFIQPEIGAASVVLSNGATVTSSFMDEVKLFDWMASDPVVLVNGTGFRTQTQLINLRTGQAVWIP